MGSQHPPRLKWGLPLFLLWQHTWDFEGGGDAGRYTPEVCGSHWIMRLLGLPARLLPDLRVSL